MRRSVGGLSFALEPPEATSPAELEVLARFAGDDGLAEEPAFRLQLAPRPAAPSGGRDVAVVAEADRLRVEHVDFTAVLDPVAGIGRLERDADQGFPLALTLRLAMSSRLPLLGGVPLHAAGIVRDGRADVFFGPSGAGKSTLAALSRDPLLSDELVAVRPVPGDPARFVGAATGVWGTLGDRAAPRGLFPLRSLIQLDRGDRFVLERLRPPQALRALVGVAMVPAAGWLWEPALRSLARVIQSVPVYRMYWRAAQAPFDMLEGRLSD